MNLKPNRNDLSNIPTEEETESVIKGIMHLWEVDDDFRRFIFSAKHDMQKLLLSKDDNATMTVEFDKMAAEVLGLSLNALDAFCSSVFRRTCESKDE